MLKAVCICLAALVFCASTRADTQADLANQAEQLIRQGSTQEALDTLAKAAAATPASAQAEDRIGFLYAVMQHADEAIDHFQKSIAIDSGYAAAHFHLGIALWNRNATDRGTAELEQAVKLAPDVPDYRVRLGVAYEKLGRALQAKGDLAGAAGELQRAVDTDPTNDVTRNEYAFLLIETRQPDRGIAESRTVLTHKPNDTNALMNIGYAYLKTGGFDTAEKTYRQALAVDPTLPAAHYDLALALKMQDQIEAAQKEFEETIRLDPSLAQAHYSLGITYWQLGDFPTTIKEMRAAVAIAPDYAEAHYMLGIVLKQSGDLDQAISELKEAIRLDPSTPGPFNTLGQILRVKGDKRGSEEAFATGARLKREKESQLASSLDQGMRGGETLKPLSTEPH
jgi:tetratricopeptide (TPR) repeat protein